MSSILKALRKVEEEKRAVSHAAPDLRSPQEGSTPGSKPFLPLMAGIVLGVFCVLIVYYVFSGADTVVPPPPAQVVQQSMTVPSTPAPLVEQKTIPVVIMPAEPVAVVQPVRKPVERPVDPVAKIASPPATKINDQPVSTEESTAVASKKDITPPKIVQSLPKDVSLVVSEIFYQEDAANSMAVINDLPVMAGTPVDGALVSEIHPDHVLFVIDGKRYPVYPAAR